MLAVPSPMPTSGGMKCSPKIFNNLARLETTSSSPTDQATPVGSVRLALLVGMLRLVMTVEMTTSMLKSRSRFPALFVLFPFLLFRR